jgi:hypothetical protein
MRERLRMKLEDVSIPERQTVASTSLDSHGDRISSEELRMLFDQWRENTPAGVMHDLSQPPVCRAFNKRIEALPDGELALKVDLEVLDEAEFAKFGGFSISFSPPVLILVGDSKCTSGDLRMVDEAVIVEMIQTHVAPSVAGWLLNGFQVT